jgi:hypothetical protein
MNNLAILPHIGRCLLQKQNIKFNSVNKKNIKELNNDNMTTCDKTNDINPNTTPNTNEIPLLESNK